MNNTPKIDTLDNTFIDTNLFFTADTIDTSENADYHMAIMENESRILHWAIDDFNNRFPDAPESPLTNISTINDGDTIVLYGDPDGEPLALYCFRINRNDGRVQLHFLERFESTEQRVPVPDPTRTPVDSARPGTVVQADPEAYTPEHLQNTGSRTDREIAKLAYYTAVAAGFDLIEHDDGTFDLIRRYDDLVYFTFFNNVRLTDVITICKDVENGSWEMVDYMITDERRSQWLALRESFREDE